MAKRRNTMNNTTSVETRSFRGMNKDSNESLLQDGDYINARNAVSNTSDGEMGVRSNEQSNKFCTEAPYDIIGIIHMYADNYAIFSTDDINSEIGWFKKDVCEYTKVANDPCLGFKKSNPIIGEAKETEECTWEVFWADNLNPDRYIDMEKPPFIQDCITTNDCVICEDTEDLDCEKLRMSRLSDTPCVKIRQSNTGGEILNGTYYVQIAYSENQQKVTDYYPPSNSISIFDHNNVGGSIDIEIQDIDQSYEEFELVIVKFVNQQLVAKKLGYYSTRSQIITIDQISNSLPSVDLGLLQLITPSYERSEGIYKNGDYLLRIAPSTRFSFNYQPLANDINTKWQAIRYSKDYYRDPNHNVSYLRDEVYCFFIRWRYQNGDVSESYHIPGRAPNPNETATISSPAYGTGFFFEENNTATIQPASEVLDDGGVVFAQGNMAYHQSSEKYPDQKPDIWGNLCGKNIRHHKFPDNEIINHFNSDPSTTEDHIAVLGVKFNNIAPPVDNQGNPIPGIAGFEILRGTRRGNKTIVAKGIINNMGSYIRPDNNRQVFYQNYPYNDLREDPYLSQDWVNGDNPNGGPQPAPLGGNFYAKDKFTFHSPDTQFTNPFLSAKELKIYETFHGQVRGKFIEVEGHPKHKLITDFSFIASAFVGFGIAVKAIIGERKIKMKTGGVTESQWAGTTTNSALLSSAASTTWYGAATGSNLTSTNIGGDVLLAIFTGTNQTSPGSIQYTTDSIAFPVAAGVPGTNMSYEKEYDSVGNGLPPALNILQGLPMFLSYWGQGTDTMLRVLKSISEWQQYALAYKSHCHYDNSISNSIFNNANLKVGIKTAGYIKGSIQQLDDFEVNNIYRNQCVGVVTDQTIIDPFIADQSRLLLSDIPYTGDWNGWDNIGNEKDTGISSCHYVGLKQRLRNQYGQLDSIIQLPASYCMQELKQDPDNPNKYISDVIFGGDTYIGRYTEKTTMFFFTDWMEDMVDGYEGDYRLDKMMPYPTYWMNTKDFQMNDFLQGIFDNITGGSGNNGSPLASGFHNFDALTSESGSFVISLTGTIIVRDKYMYLFNSGIRDFYVESEVNIEQRDWDDNEKERHYDPYGYTDYDTMFNTKNIKAPLFHKYDWSLSKVRVENAYSTWGRIQDRSYDPIIAEKCYSYYPNRLLYSLPQGINTQNIQSKKNQWLVYLVNNYRDFLSRITAIEPIGKTGAIMLFENRAPIMFNGVDTLETGNGVKVTIGDSGLFNQALQNINNADDAHEFGSCQSRLSIINTTTGLYWISQDQGKIFSYASNMREISNIKMKWWFRRFLPSMLLQDFPNYDLKDNTIIGVGCQSIFDATNQIVYFCKRDFKLKEEYKENSSYIGNNQFRINDVVTELGDPRFFDDASWTISFDPKSNQGQGGWLSFHDWHPNLTINSNNYFMTIRNNSIWGHSERTDSFCNFYGIDYPFEMEFSMPTGQSVNSLRNIEYLMECYQWRNNNDKHHVLDFNFDRAVVYNTEQISGELRLNITPKNNAPMIVNYPQIDITTSTINILYSKEEHKYRFNQFWDITDDRGEFTNARRNLWITRANGYIKDINPVAVNYSKALHQRKKFRHYHNNVLLSRRMSGDVSMDLKIANVKNKLSLR